MLFLNKLVPFIIWSVIILPEAATMPAPMQPTGWKVHFIFLHLPVAQHNVATAVLSNFRVMRYKMILLPVKLLKKNQISKEVRLSRGFSVPHRAEITAGLLIMPGNSHALHLSATHLIAFVHQTITPNPRLQCFNGPVLSLGGVDARRVVHGGELHVFNRE